MRSTFTVAPLTKIMQNVLGGGLSLIRKRTLGRGAWGFAVPVVLFIVEDISRPDGVVLPFCKWILNRSAAVRIVEMSAQPCRTSPENSGEASGPDKGADP